MTKNLLKSSVIEFNGTKKNQNSQDNEYNKKTSPLEK